MFDGARPLRGPGARLRAVSRPISAGAAAALAVGRLALAPVSPLVYRLYAGHLMNGARSHPLPKHVAMILDGNRRFARHNGLPALADGYKHGGDKVSEVVGWCDDLSIPVVTLWGLSTENLERDPSELGKIFQIVGDRLRSLSREGAQGSTRRRIRAVGRLELLPDELREQIEAAERQTADFGPNILNVAVAYGGRDEILDAVKRLLRTRGGAGDSPVEIADSLSGDDLQPFLYAPDIPEPDLIIRTSGEVRLSGFLLWQSVHSELYFCDVPWPAFRKIDFLRAIRSFQARQRRFGR